MFETKNRNELLELSYDEFWDYNDSLLEYIDSLKDISQSIEKSNLIEYKKEVLIPTSLEVNDIHENSQVIESIDSNSIQESVSCNEFESEKLDDLVNRYFITLIPKCDKGDISINDHRLLIHVLRKLADRLESIPIAAKIAAKDARKKKFSSTKWNNI